MCTVSWIHEPDGYQLFCNRDEKRTRPAADPPRIHERDGVRWLAPVDPAGGGAWIGVNQTGVAVCLLNRSGSNTTCFLGARSRGLLTWELLDAAGADEARLRLQFAGQRGWGRRFRLPGPSFELCPKVSDARDIPAGDRQLLVSTPALSLHAPFTVLVLEPGRPALIADWDGQNLSIDPHGDARMPLISSSFDPIGVDIQRRAEFRRMAARNGGITASLLRSYHQSHGVCPGPYSVCMHRGDAETVSFTRVRVAEDAIELAYSPQPLCANPEEESYTLERRFARVA